MLALALSLVCAAPPAPRLLYEQKCLYCHSESVAEAQKRTEPQWRRLVERMRLKAPLLISRADTEVLTRYISRTLKLGLPGKVAPPKPAPSTTMTPPQVPEPPTMAPTVEPETLEAAMDPVPFPEPRRQPDPELEARATEVISRRCSRCHSLGRVYGRLDTFERSMTTLERMRMKTGSGITEADLALLEQYLRVQFDQPN